MKPDTYNIPAYKFEIIIPIEPINATSDFESVTKFNSSIATGKIISIPWESFDGLTIADAFKYLERKDFMFLCSVTWENDNRSSLTTTKNGLFNIGFRFDLTKDFANMRVDKAIESYMEEQYSKASETEKKVFRCFFERYQDRNYEETKERIKRLS